MLRLLIIMCFSFCVCNCVAQSFTIQDIDTSGFPQITVFIKNLSGIALDKATTTITESGNIITGFSLFLNDGKQPLGNKSGNSDNDQSVCFLIENGGFTSLQQVQAVKDAIAQNLRVTTNIGKANVCFFNRTKSSGALNRVSSEFTANKPILIDDMYKAVRNIPEKQPSTDLHKALYECIDYMSGISGLPGNKMIILIATGNKNGKSPINLNDCAKLANEKNITVNGIGLKSYNMNAPDNVKLIAQQLGGKYETGETAGEIERALESFTQTSANESRKEKDTTSGTNYLLAYTSNASPGEVVTVEVKAGANAQKANYTAPQTGKTKKKSANALYYIGAGVLLVGLLITLLIVQNSKKQKRLTLEAEVIRNRTENERRQQQMAEESEQLKKQEEEKHKREAQGAQIPKTEFVQKPPVPGAATTERTQFSGTSLPQLFITVAGQTYTYNLTGSMQSVGRSPQNDIVINSLNVSGKHAMIGMENGSWYITDVGSTNGTIVAGKRVQKVQIINGTRIQFADAICTFKT